MKRLYIFFSLLLVAVFGIATLSWAGEASFYDETEDWIIRAYTVGAASPFTVKVEVRDTNNTLIPEGNLIGISGNPATVVTNATSSDVSLSFDTQSGKTYIFYTTSGGIQLTSYTISSGGPKIVVTPTSLIFGDVNVGATKDLTATVKNEGTATLSLGTIAVSGTYFSRQGGTCVNGQNLSPNSTCTITVRFAPQAAGTYNGNLSIPSNDQNKNVPLSGTGVSQASNADLIVGRVSFANCCDNNKPFTVNVEIKNQGTGAAGAFTVKGYISADTVIGPIGNPPNDMLLFTWSVSGLNAGEVKNSQFTCQFGVYPIHQYYYIIVKVDADNQIPETDENNNTKTFQFFLSR